MNEEKKGEEAKKEGEAQEAAAGVGTAEAATPQAEAAVTKEVASKKEAPDEKEEGEEKAKEPPARYRTSNMDVDELDNFIAIIFALMFSTTLRFGTRALVMQPWPRGPGVFVGLLTLFTLAWHYWHAQAPSVPPHP